MFQKIKIKKSEVDKLLSKDIYSEDGYKSFCAKYNDLHKSIAQGVQKRVILESIIDSEEITLEKFPTKELGKFDIFISHSHEDFELVVKFASWLEEKLGLRCFIDRIYWGFADNVMDEIYKKYCSTDNEIHNCEVRHISETNVHTMVSMALMEMIDLTECVIFVDSINSYNNTKGTTLSPWIYEELCFLNKLRIIPPKRKSLPSKQIITEQRKYISPIQFSYKISTDGLFELSAENLYKVEEDLKSIKHKNDVGLIRREGEFALNQIYYYVNENLKKKIING